MVNNGKRLLLVAALTCLVLAGLAGYGDVREVWKHVAGFPLWSLLAALALAGVNYFLRFLRWSYYLRVLNLSVPLKISLLVFLTGLAMTITPGKLGELLKCYLLRDYAGIPVPNSAPAVLMERVTDLLSVAAMALLGLALLPAPVAVVLGVVLGGSALLVYLATTRHTDRILRLPVIRRWSGEISEAREGVRALSRPRPMTIAALLGLVAWVSEGVALWVVLRGLGADLDFLVSLPIYAGSVLAGAITTLPGGLVGTEGAMVALLQQLGMERDVAAAGTLVVRLVTLWFAVVVGLVALGWLHWVVGRRVVGRRTVAGPNIPAPTEATGPVPGVAEPESGKGNG